MSQRNMSPSSSRVQGILRTIVEPGYNDIGLYDTLPIALDTLCYE